MTGTPEIRRARARWVLPLAVLAALLALAARAAPAGASLGISKFLLSTRNQDGSLDDQAGSHPYALTSTFALREPGPKTGDVKDVALALPPGLVGNPNATPRCDYQDFVRQEKKELLCPNQSVVGIATTYIKRTENGAELENLTATSDPVYNLTPPKGVAAEFGYIVASRTPVLLQSGVRTGGDYGVTTTVPEVNQAVVVAAGKVTIWGDPAESSHDPIRGTCERELLGQESPPEAPGFGLRETGEEDQLEGPIYLAEEEREIGLPESKGHCPSESPPTPLLTNPTACGQARTASFTVDSWQQPGVPVSEQTSMPPLSGCESLPFHPTLSVKPEQSTAGTPTGLEVQLNVPQDGTESPTGLADAAVKDSTVTLPAGFQLNAAAANGLAGCTTAQAGFTGFREYQPLSEPGIRTATFDSAPASCPDASKLANVHVRTPLLAGELTGGVYLAAPQNILAGLPENPFSSLIAFYLIAEEPQSGVLVKLTGRVELGEAGVEDGLAPGQIRAIFQQSPQLPFSRLKLDFYGGEHAALATPAQCGNYTTRATFTSWASTARNTESTAGIGPAGPAGQPCSGPLPFAPSLDADSENVNAGAFSALSTSITRPDGQQQLRGVAVTYPPGLSAKLAGVPLCGQSHADAGTCPAASQIGEASAAVGVGPDPYLVTGGRVYLTEGYEGAPYGLSIVTPAGAGPFDLGQVVVRTKIQVDPTSAQVSVTSGEIPTMLRGIPLEIRRVQVNVNRPGFTVNPTSCNAVTIAATIQGGEGAGALASSPFQLANCSTLKFTPRFSASTEAHSSRALGASLTTRIEEPAGALGTQANIARVKVQLPAQLPSQLRTLQKACLARTFQQSPDACVRESPHAKVGDALVRTPLLADPLSGSAYLVSHGGEAFPSLTIVLHGDGITIQLVGTTYIKKGITTTTFQSAPDVPFTSFQLTLPRGAYSALGAYLPAGAHESFCGQKLVMPTEMIAQNGTVLHQETRVTVSGCPASVHIVRARIHGRSLAVTVKLGQPGTLTLAGAGLHRRTIHAAKAGTRTVLVALSAAGLTARRTHRRLRVSARLTAAKLTGTAATTIRA